MDDWLTSVRDAVADAAGMDPSSLGSRPLTARRSSTSRASPPTTAASGRTLRCSATSSARPPRAVRASRQSRTRYGNRARKSHRPLPPAPDGPPSGDAGATDALHEAFPEWTDAREATEVEILRCHTESYVHVVKTIDGPTWLDADTPASQTTYRAALLAAGGAIQAVERGGFALVRPPGHHALRPRDGLLLLQRRHRRPFRAGRARPGAHRDPRLGRPPRQRDARHLLGRRQRALRLASRVAVLPGLGGRPSRRTRR